MDNQLPTEIDRLLQDLQSSEEDYARKIAVDKLGELDHMDERIIQALKQTQRVDKNEVVRNTANAVLRKHGIETESEVATSQQLDVQVPPDENSPRSTLFKDFGIPMLVILFCIIGIICVGQVSSSISIGECSPIFMVFTFIDENADGVFQTGEPPLPNVVIRLDTPDNLTHPAPSERTNWSGNLGVRVGMTACNSEVPLKAEVPAGYRLTTPGTILAREKDKGRVVQFGFTYLPGIPTATPRPTTKCTAIPEFEGHGISAIVSDEENLWVVANIVAKLNFSSNAWTFFDGKAYTGWPQNILISPDGSIWLIADQPNPKWSPQTAGKSDEPLSFSFIYQLVKGEWREFSPEVLYHKYIQSISWAPDGSMWFSTWGDGAFNWNPTTDQWSSDATLKFVHEILFAKDGKQFNIEELGGGAIAPDGKVWGVSRIGYDGIWEGYYYDPETHVITQSAITTIQSSDSICYSDMKIDSQGGMWLATCSDGLLYIPDPINGGKESWHDYHSDIGFPSNETLSLYLQNDNILWIGTKEGLARCQVHTR